VEEGIVAGGGVALIRCLPVLEALKLEGDEQIGVDIIKRAIEEPTRALAKTPAWKVPSLCRKSRSAKGNDGYKRRHRRIRRSREGRRG